MGYERFQRQNCTSIAVSYSSASNRSSVMAALPRNPLSWAEYEGRSVSIGSIESNAVEDDALLEDEGDNETHPLLGQERRR